MKTALLRPLALLLSIAAHLGAALIFSSHGKLGKGALLQRSLSTPVIVARLRSPAPIPAVPELSHQARQNLTQPASDSQSPPDSQDTVPEPAPATLPMPVGEVASTLLPTVALAQPRYFKVTELTEKPQVLQDIPPEKILALPDISPRPTQVQLLINERGEIDKLVIENTDLSEQARQFVIEAFGSVKFSPGKLGDLPVKSQLHIEVTLENAISPIVPESVTVVH